MNNINLYAWHLPLDVHPELGNNTQFSFLLDIKIIGYLNPFVPYGEFTLSLSAKELHFRLEKIFNNKVIYCRNGKKKEIKKIAWCTGNGQKFIELAAQENMDAFITGEVSEFSFYIAQECDLHVYSVGHHATELGGIQALGKWLTEQYRLNVTFVNIPNIL